MPDTIAPTEPSAPTTPAAPSPSPAAKIDLTPPAVPPEASPGQKSWTDALEGLDSTESPEPKLEPSKDPEAPKTPPEAIKEPPKATPKQDKPPEPARDADGMPTFRTNAELRKWAKERNAAAAAAEAKKTELENKVKQLESVVPKSQQDGELLAQKLADAQNRLAQHEQLIELQAFEHSEKYQKEYATPYYEAMARAEKRVSEMMVSEPTGEMDANDQPIVKKRPATKDDFLKIYKLPYAQAEELAATMFGRSAERVLAMRENISDLAEKAQQAIADRKANFAKYRQEEQATQSQQQIAIQNLWKTANDQISKDPKRALYWGEDKDDPEANKALAKGFQLADEFFSEKRDQMTPDQRVEFDAYIRHSIASVPRLAYKLHKLTAELKARNEEIAQLRGSAPGAPKPVGEEQSPKDKDLNAALSELPD